MAAKSALDLLPAVSQHVLLQAAQGHKVLALRQVTSAVDRPKVLGNPQAGWLQKEEDAKQRQFYTPKMFKIVLMKPINVTRTVTFDV